MIVHVLFFSSLRDAVGLDELEVELAEPATVDGLLSLLQDQLSEPAHAALTAERVRIALNQEIVPEQRRAASVSVRPGDEVAFLPPVTGG